MHFMHIGPATSALTIGGTPTAGEPIYEAWRNSLITLGKKVQTKMGETVYDGIAESVARDGSLQLRHSDGSLSKIIAGDVTLRDRI